MYELSKIRVQSDVRNSLLDGHPLYLIVQCRYGYTGAKPGRSMKGVAPTSQLFMILQ